MTDSRYEQIKAALENAVRTAIEGMGIDRFKETSFFGSNERQESEIKKAA